MIWVRWCIPGTKAAFRNALKFNPHILHFVGHGGFEVALDGYPSQGFLCFQGEDDLSDPMTADDLAVLLRNSSVRLAVMTACSSAKPAPMNPAGLNPYDTLAFEGVAQKLVTGISGVTVCSSNAV